MISVPDPSLYRQRPVSGKLDKDAHLRYVAARRWQVQRDQQRKRQASKPANRVQQIRELRPGRAVANSLSPVYNMFNDRFFRGR